MAVDTANLLTPVGELNRELLFPALTSSQLEEMLQVWLDQAVAEMTTKTVKSELHDGGATAHAYYRAYDQVVERLSAQPTSKSLSDAGISVSYSADQRKTFVDKRNSWKYVWEGILATSIAQASMFPSTQPVKTQVTW